MKTLLRKGIALATLTFAMGVTYAQLKITGEVRPRFEYRHGFIMPADSGQAAAAYVDQRTRLYFDYSKERIQMKLVLQDVRVWGSQPQLMAFTGQSNPAGQMTWMHEAWGLAKLNDNWAFKFGRQELVYDDHRILGSVAWLQQARSHDAGVFQYTGDKLKLHFGGAWNQAGAALSSTSYTGVGSSYKAMQYLWGNYKVSDAFNFSFLAMGLGQEVQYINQSGVAKHQDNYTLTTGTRVSYKKDKLGVFFNGYYQMGSTNQWPARSVSAYDIGLDISYQVMEPLKLTLGFEMLSGNSQTDTTAAYGDVQHAFNPYFGTNHKFNGFMDFFYVGPSYQGKVGLNDFYLTADYKHDKFTAGLTGHVFMSNADIRDTDWDVDPANTTGEIRAMAPMLGTEIDVFGGFNLAPGCAVKLGYSHFIGTRAMEMVKGGDLESGDTMQNWGWCMIILKPVLFEQK